MTIAAGLPKTSQTRRLSHLYLLGGYIVIRRSTGRKNWMLVSAHYPDGRSPDPLEALANAELELNDHASEYPRLVTKDEWDPEEERAYLASVTGRSLPENEDDEDDDEDEESVPVPEFKAVWRPRKGR